MIFHLSSDGRLVAKTWVFMEGVKIPDWSKINSLFRGLTFTLAKARGVALTWRKAPLMWAGANLPPCLKCAGQNTKASGKYWLFPFASLAESVSQAIPVCISICDNFWVHEVNYSCSIRNLGNLFSYLQAGFQVYHLKNHQQSSLPRPG